MIWGLTTETFTLVHVIISLVGIATGFAVVYGFLAAKRLEAVTAVFLATTVATSVTGFGFPFEKLGGPHFFGIISLVALAIAIVARYPKSLAGGWRAAFVVTAMLSQYLNVFVGVVQSFLKIPAIKALAPTQQEPPFAIAQGAVFLIFIVLTILSVKRFRPAAT